jgi:hypothetical protein
MGRLLRELAYFLNTPCPQASSFAAMQVVLRMRLWPERFPNFKSGCELTKVRISTFHAWERKIPPLPPGQMEHLRRGGETKLPLLRAAPLAPADAQHAPLAPTGAGLRTCETATPPQLVVAPGCGADASGVRRVPFANYKQLVDVFEALVDGADAPVIDGLLRELACFLSTPMAAPSALAAMRVVLLMRMFTSSYPSFEKACLDANVSATAFNTWHCKIPMLALQQMKELRSGRAVAVLSPSEATLSLANAQLPNPLAAGYVIPRGMALLAYAANSRPRLQVPTPPPSPPGDTTAAAREADRAALVTAMTAAALAPSKHDLLGERWGQSGKRSEALGRQRPAVSSGPQRVALAWAAPRTLWLAIAAIGSAVTGATATGPTALLSLTGLAAAHARPPSLGRTPGALPSSVWVCTAAAATVAAAGWRTFKPKAPIRKALVSRSSNTPLMPPAAQARRNAGQARHSNEPLAPPKRQASSMSRPVGERTGAPTKPKQLGFESGLVSHPDPESIYALQPSDGGVYLRLVMRRVQQSIDYGVNSNTKAGEKSAWSKYYSPYCKLMGTAEWRGFEAVSNAAHETSFTCGFAMHVWTCMQPRRKSDKAPRVDSVRNVLGHIRRSHARRGFPTAEWSMVGHMLKGLTLQRIADFGLALAERAEPFTATENIAMKNLPSKVGGRVCDVSTRFWANWLMVDTYADQAGPRKSEIVGTAVIGFTRADVQFTVDGVTYSDPPPEVLQSFANGRDSVTVAVNVSKADYDGSRFGNSLISLLYNTENRMSFAVACVTYELLFPLRGLQRYHTPLFTPDGVKPWKESQIDGTLRAVMAATLTPQQRVGKTFHSKRAWVATALRALSASDAEIQAFVRWSSPESLKLYARWDLIYQAKRRDELAGAHVTSLNTVRRGLIEPTLADVDSMRSIADDMINAE